MVVVVGYSKASSSPSSARSCGTASVVCSIIGIVIAVITIIAAVVILLLGLGTSWDAGMRREFQKIIVSVCVDLKFMLHVLTAIIHSCCTTSIVTVTNKIHMQMQVQRMSYIALLYKIVQ